jgi:diguanylate cyclase (GGDEF)-like protein
MLSSLIQKRDHQPTLFSIVVFGLLALATVSGYQFAKQQEHARIAHAFDDMAALEAQRVQLQVDSYARTLLDLRGLFLADANVTNEEFRRYLQGVEVSQRYPAILRFGYAARVTHANRVQLESRLKRMGLNGYEAAPGDFPVLYTYPTADEQAGRSLKQGPSRGEVLDQARDMNQPQISPQLPLQVDGERRPGFVLYAPLYGDSLAPATVERRRQALSGYLFAAFLTADLISSTIETDLKTQMHLSLFDGPEPAPGRLAYESGNRFKAPAGVETDRYQSVQRVRINGRPWTFVFVALPAFVLHNRSDLPLVVLVGGLLTSILAGLLSYAGSRRWLAESRIRYLAFHDELTGLPNRAQLRICILEAIEQEQDTKRLCSLLIVELVRFRDINYTLGHQIGDEVLKQASVRIRHLVDGGLTLARISNVQFGVLLPDANQSIAIDLAQRLVAAMEEPLPARDSKYELGARAGIALMPSGGCDPDDLIRHADIALNRARSSGAAYALYDPALDPYKPQRLALLGAFRQAIKEDQLEMYCQPKANLRTGQITSVEALVRWRHPEYGLIMPDQFISLIEPTELIQLLTQWMLECAIRQFHEWRQNDLFLPLAVNLSTRNLLNSALPELIAGLMKTWGADASWLSLEITESSIMDDPALSLRVLNRLNAMGLELIVDDFGTGYSSLSYLMKLPVAVIKIDQSFITNLISDPDAAAIVKTMIELAHNMGMKVVAEGAETKEIWDALKRLDCDEAQGYYISHPMPAHALPAWLERSPWQLAPA